LVAIIWDETGNTRTVEIVEQYQLARMYRKKTLRSTQIEVCPTIKDIRTNDGEIESNNDLNQSNVDDERGNDKEMDDKVDQCDSSVDEEISTIDADQTNNNVAEDVANKEDANDSDNDDTDSDDDSKVDDENESALVEDEDIIDNELVIRGSLEDRFLQDYKHKSVRADASKFRVTVQKKFTLPNTPASWYVVPNDVYENEKSLHSQLTVLHDMTKNIPNVSLIIGGRERTFWTFHYPAGNTYPTNSRRGICEYVEVCENRLLYRYDIKAAVSMSSRERGTSRKLRLRLFVSYTYLICNDSEKFTPKRFVLVSIMSTLCNKPWNVYLIWDNVLDIMVEWQNEQIINCFWCDFTSKIDYKTYRERLDLHFRRKSYIYDPSRTILRDYHDVGETFFYYNFMNIYMYIL